MGIFRPTSGIFRRRVSTGKTPRGNCGNEHRRLIESFGLLEMPRRQWRAVFPRQDLSGFHLVSRKRCLSASAVEPIDRIWP